MTIEELLRMTEKLKKASETAEDEQRALEIIKKLMEPGAIDRLDFEHAVFSVCGKTINSLRKKAKLETVRKKCNELKENWTKIIIQKTMMTKSTTVTTKDAKETKTNGDDDYDNKNEKNEEETETIKKDQQEEAQAGDDKSALEQIQRTIIDKVERTNNATRDRTREVIAYGLALAHCEGNCKNISLMSLSRIAEEVEDAMCEKWKDLGKEYKAKLRQLAFNTRDPKNPDLRRAIAMREIDAQTLIDLSSEELGSDERRAANQSIREKAEAENVRGQRKEASTTAFKCGKCGQRACTFYQLQTRSADEPMTTFVTCVNCENRWKFC
jgi:transcription elongation factor S-II